MSHPFVFFVEVDCVVHVELPHIPGEILLCDLYEQMVVVGHEAVVVEGDVMAFGIEAHQLFEVFIV